MNSTPQKNVTKSANSFHMIRALGGIGIVCALLIVTVFQLTEPIIKKKKALALEKAIYMVVPGATKKLTFELLADGTFKLMEADIDGTPRIFAGLNEKGDLVGFAIEASGNGFQDVIKMIYGYSHIDQTVVGTHILETKETPGLGDKIEKDEHFLKNFEALDVSVDPSGEQMLHPIELVKPGKKTQPWQIDSITGATISSKAMSRIISVSTTNWAPKIQKSLNDIKDQINE